MTLTATPAPDSEIISWNNCDEVSPDLTRCEIALDADRQIGVNFGYKTADIAENFIDLSAAEIIFIDANGNPLGALDADGWMKVRIEPTQTALWKHLEVLQASEDGYYITGDEGEGFLRKVIEIKQQPDPGVTEFLFRTVEASLEEVVKQGTLFISKNFTYDEFDIEELNQRAVRLGRRAPAADGAIPVGEQDGVFLVPPSNPNEEVFTLKFDDYEIPASPSSDRATRSLSLVSVKGETDLYNNILKVEGEVSVALVGIDFGLSWDYGILDGLSIESFKFVPKIELKEKIALKISGDVDGFFNKKKKIKSIPLKRQVVFVGYLPVYLKLALDFYLGANGKLSAEVNVIEIESTQKIQGGFVYSDVNGFKFVKKFDIAPNLVKPSAGVSLSAEIVSFAQAGFGLYLYGLPLADTPLVTGSLKLKTDLIDFKTSQGTTECPANRSLSTWAGIIIEAGRSEHLSQDLKKYKLTRPLAKILDKLKVELFKNEWLLAKAPLGADCLGPAYLHLTGGDIVTTVSLPANEKITQVYTVKNTGSAALDWRLDPIDDGVTKIEFLNIFNEVVTQEMKLSYMDSQLVRVTVDPKKIPAETTYRKKLKFVNKVDPGLLVTLTDEETGTTERDIVVKVTADDPDAPDGVTWGDPHLVTFDRLSYDFQGAGEFILVKEPDQDFEIQVRQEPWHGSKSVTINTAIAMNVGGNKVGFYLGQPPRINGVHQPLSDNEPYLFDAEAHLSGGYVNKRGNTYTVVWPDGKGAVKVTDRSTWLWIDVYLTQEQKGQVTGLLGNADGDNANDIAGRAGEQIPITEVHTTYAESWRLQAADKSWFDYDGVDPNSFTIQNFPKPADLKTVETLDAATYVEAEKVCREARILNDALLQGCILDYVLTKDESFVQKLPLDDTPLDILPTVENVQQVAHIDLVEGALQLQVRVEETNETFDAELEVHPEGVVLKELKPLQELSFSTAIIAPAYKPRFSLTNNTLDVPVIALPGESGKKLYSANLYIAHPPPRLKRTDVFFAFGHVAPIGR